MPFHEPGCVAPMHPRVPIWESIFPRRSDDPQAEVGGVPTLFAQNKSKDRQAQKPGNVQHSRKSQTAREGRAVFQAGRLRAENGAPPPRVDFNDGRKGYRVPLSRNPTYAEDLYKVLHDSHVSSVLRT